MSPPPAPRPTSSRAIVAGYPSPALEAGRQVALGRVLLAEGDAAGAVREFRAAIKGWREVGAPYEVARARAILSRALRASTMTTTRDLELEAALDVFRRLGARIDVEAAERELRDAEDRRSGPQTAPKTFMFTDIVGSTSLAEALGDQAWERLLRWHDDMLRASWRVGEGRSSTRPATGSSSPSTAAARASTARSPSSVRCVITAPAPASRSPVRIGLHSAEANRRGSDYSGKGVHVAARVACLAEGGEILATTDTVAEAGSVATSDRGRHRSRASPIRCARLGHLELDGAFRPTGLALCRPVGHTPATARPAPNPSSGAHAAGTDGAKGNWLPRDGCSALLRRAARA